MNIICVDEIVGPVIISALKLEDSNTYRILLRSKKGDVRTEVELKKKPSPKEIVQAGKYQMTVGVCTQLIGF
jgi:hypothetical protein